MRKRWPFLSCLWRQTELRTQNCTRVEGRRVQFWFPLSLKQSTCSEKAVPLPGTAEEGWDRRVSPRGTSWSAYRERGAQFLSNPTLWPRPSPPPIPGCPHAHFCSLACGTACCVCEFSEFVNTHRHAELSLSLQHRHLSKMTLQSSMPRETVTDVLSGSAVLAAKDR